MSVEKKRIAIIGAGASGLPAIRHALIYGFEPVCFELTDDIGGLWNYKQGARNVDGVDLSSVMKTTVINTSKEMGAYSDFLADKNAPIYMHNTELLKYFKKYAAHYELLKYIKFNHRVVSVDRNSDFETTGRWRVTYTDHDKNQATGVFDGVLLCSGHHSIPNVPEPWPGQAQFKGKVTHSHDYHDHVGYEDKVVVVVGIGNSGGDISVELSRICSQVYLCMRRGTWLRRRLVDGGIPGDNAFTRGQFEYVSRCMTSSQFNKLQEDKASEWVDHDKYGLRPQFPMMAAHPTVNDELPNRIANGTVKPKPQIKEFTEHGLVFVDGSVIEHVDEVILSTGYWFHFPLIEGGKLIPVQENVADLYMNMYSPNMSRFNSLAVVGLVQPLGSIMPISELQTRVFYDVLSGNSRLPDEKGMWKEIEQRRSALRQRYVNSPRHTIQVDFVPYMDQLADLIGCKPNVLKIALTDPVLAWSVWNTPPMPYTYRILGPHPWSGARDAVSGCYDRIYSGMSGYSDYNKDAKKAKRGLPWIKIAFGLGALGYVAHRYDDQIINFVHKYIH